MAPDLPMAMVATGTPPGICTVDRSESIPWSAEEASGTPMTGSVVCAATTPARCAACPEGDSNREAAGLRGFAEGGGSGGRVRGARPDRLGALAAVEKAVAGEAVTVAGEEVGHLFLPGVDEAHPLVIGHAAHLEKQADVLPRLVVDAEELEDPASGGRTVRVLLEVAHAKMLARVPARLNARAAGPRGRRSRLLVRFLGAFGGVPGDIGAELPAFE